MTNEGLLPEWGNICGNTTIMLYTGYKNAHFVCNVHKVYKYSTWRPMKVVISFTFWSKVKEYFPPTSRMFSNIFIEYWYMSVLYYSGKGKGLNKLKGIVFWSTW